MCEFHYLSDKNGEIRKERRAAEKIQIRLSLSLKNFTWNTELRWDKTTVEFFASRSLRIAIILFNGKAMGFKCLCGIYPIMPLKNGNK